MYFFCTFLAVAVSGKMKLTGKNNIFCEFWDLPGSSKTKIRPFILFWKQELKSTFLKESNHTAPENFV